MTTTVAAVISRCSSTENYFAASVLWSFCSIQKFCLKVPIHFAWVCKQGWNIFRRIDNCSPMVLKIEYRTHANRWRSLIVAATLSFQVETQFLLVFYAVTWQSKKIFLNRRCAIYWRGYGNSSQVSNLRICTLKTKCTKSPKTN